MRPFTGLLFFLVASSSASEASAPEPEPFASPIAWSPASAATAVRAALLSSTTATAVVPPAPSRGGHIVVIAPGVDRDAVAVCVRAPRGECLPLDELVSAAGNAMWAVQVSARDAGTPVSAAAFAVEVTRGGEPADATVSPAPLEISVLAVENVEEGEADLAALDVSRRAAGARPGVVISVGSDDGTTHDEWSQAIGLSNGVPVSGNIPASGGYARYTFTTSGALKSFVFSVTPLSGDPDILVGTDVSNTMNPVVTDPTSFKWFSNSVRRDVVNVLAPNPSTTPPTPGDPFYCGSPRCTYYIAVYAEGATGALFIITAQEKSGAYMPLIDGEPTSSILSQGVRLRPRAHECLLSTSECATTRDAMNNE